LTAASVRRGLLVTGLLVLAFLALLDLLRHDSLLRRAWTSFEPVRQTPAEQAVKEFQRTRQRPIRR
jgi:hypothetical protein